MTLQGDEPKEENDDEVHPFDEMEIECHVIKKQGANDKRSKWTVKKLDIICGLPLLIKDILRICVPEEPLPNRSFNLFGVKFKTVCFYGRLSLVRANQKHRKMGIYELDDGTDTILVHFNHSQQVYLESYNKVCEHIWDIRQHASNDHWPLKDLSTDLVLLLNRAKANVSAPMQFFELGRKAFVFGFPIRYGMDFQRQTNRVYALEMVTHGDEDCDFEIYFKELLYYAYSKQFEIK